MKAQVGDELIVEKSQTGEPRRVGRIVALESADGSPPYLVRWVAGDYESLVFPWPGVRIRHRAAGRARHGERRPAARESRVLDGSR